MLHVRLIILVLPLYYNNVKISLRNENSDIFCKLSKEYYGIKESSLDEHRDEHVSVKAKMCSAIVTIPIICTVPCK